MTVIKMICITATRMAIIKANKQTNKTENKYPKTRMACQGTPNSHSNLEGKKKKQEEDSHFLISDITTKLQ